MTRASLWVFAVAVVCAVAYLVVCYVVTARLSAPVRRPVERTPADFGLGYREVEVRSSDGLRLSAWWVEGVDSSRAAVLVHGWGADKSSRHVLETAAVYEEAGFDVLMIDPRGHGGSEGDRVTLGYREVRDVRGALSWLEKRGFDPVRVVLHGWSMGGAAVIQAAPGPAWPRSWRSRPTRTCPRCCGSGSPRSANCRPSSPRGSSLWAGSFWA